MKKIFTLFLIFALFFTVSCSKAAEEFSSSVSYNDIPIETEPIKSNTLKVGFEKFTGNFNPFYANYSEDIDVVNVTSVSLVTRNIDSEVINGAGAGEVNYISGKEYTFSGIANIDVFCQADGSEVITISLDDSVKFSDGHILDIDDVIFSMYVLADPAYNGPSLFNTLPIVGLDEYKFNDLNYISGIDRINDNSVKLYLNGVDNDIYGKLSIIVAPLHYYGSDELYNFDEHKFGFKKGDLEFLRVKSANPLGAGPYSFVSYENGVVKFERNEYYYNGIPKTKYLEFIETSESEIIDDLVAGDIHIVRSDATFDTVKYISDVNNFNGGSEIKTLNLYKNSYSYIGISANNVSVLNKSDSIRSKYLRKAFATLFSVYKYDAVDRYFGVDCTIEYPLSEYSWAYPLNATEAYSRNDKGNYIYSENMSVTEKYDCALNTAKDFLIKAGYTYNEVSDKFVSAPEGAKLEYDTVILNNENDNNPARRILSDVKYALSTIGISLNIVDYKDADAFWKVVYGEECVMWVAGMQYPTQEPLLRQNYYSANNKFGISDVELDLIIDDYSNISNIDIKASRIADCFSILRDWAVEVPLYHTPEFLIINSSFVNSDTVAEDMFKNNFTDFLHIIELK